MPDEEKLQIALLIQEVRALRQAVEKTNEDHETRLRLLEGKVSQLGERLTLWQAFQMTLTGIGSGLAVFFGRQP